MAEFVGVLTKARAWGTLDAEKNVGKGCSKVLPTVARKAGIMIAPQAGYGRTIHSA